MVAATSTEVAFPLLSMMIVVPVVAALLIAVLSNRRPEYSKLVALLASVGTGALSVWTFANFDSDSSGFQFTSQHPWIES